MIFTWELVLIIAAVNGALSLMPAKLARDKGSSFLAFWLLGFFLTFIICFMVVESLEDKRAPIGDWVPINGYAKQAHPGYRDIPGYALMGIFLLGVLIMGASDTRFFTAGNLGNVMGLQFGYYAAAALATALTMKAKGPDISFVPLSVLAGFIVASGDTFTGVVIALGVCLLTGILNGVLVTLTNIPAAIATLVTGALALLATKLAYGATVKIAGGAAHSCSYLLPVIAAVICVPLVFLTKLRLPKDRPLSSSNSGSRKNQGFWRKNAPRIAAYAASAAIAFAVGYYMTMSMGSARQDSGQELYAITALIFFAVSCLRLKDSKWSIFYAVVPALAWTLLGNVMALLSVSSYYQMLLRSAVILAFSGVFFISRCWRLRSRQQPL